MKKVSLFVLSILLFYTGLSLGQTIPDACDWGSQISKTAVAVSSSTVGTFEICPAVAGKFCYLCACDVTLGGTSPTIQFEQGSSPTCSSPTVSSGTMTASAGQPLYYGIGVISALVTSAANKDICYVTTGTSPTVNGTCWYIQY